MGEILHLFSSIFNADSDGNNKEPPAENPFDHHFALWVQQCKSQVRQHLIGGENEDAKSRKSTAARLEALQGKSETDQLSEACTIIKSLERQ